VQGRKRYLEYLAILEQVVVDAAAAIKAESGGNAASALAQT
jgi:hypothetical protein